VSLDGLTEELAAWAPATQYSHANYHRITHREDLKDGARKIEAFLTPLAMAGTVSPSNQNQAMNAMVFLPKQVLTMPLDQAINAVRARRKEHVPVVRQREAVAHGIYHPGSLPARGLCRHYDIMTLVDNPPGGILATCRPMSAPCSSALTTTSEQHVRRESLPACLVMRILDTRSHAPPPHEPVIPACINGSRSKRESTSRPF
jgi:hypothetical protein